MTTLSKSAETVQRALCEKGFRFQYETLWAAAGTPYAVFSLPAKELQKVTGGKVVSVKAS